MNQKVLLIMTMALSLLIIHSCAKEEKYGAGEELKGDFTSGVFGGGRLSSDSNENGEDEKIIVTHKMKEDFVCKVKSIAEKFNQKNADHREHARGIIQGIENNNASPEELLELTKYLIMARMMVPWIKRDFYFAPSRYTQETIIRKTNEAAIKFMNSNPAGPRKCHYTKRVKEKYNFTFERDGEKITEVREHFVARWNTYPITSEECANQLNKHLASIPLGQVMAQAAEESSWGTSKLARTIENYFGLQYKFDTVAELKRRKLCKQAGKAPRRCLFIFAGLEESIWEFYRTLNAGPYQSYYREYLSKEIDDIDTCLDAEKGFDGLTNYAENKDYGINLRKHLPEVCEMAKACN
jgi:uncharacterized FlgJ-related protein